MDAGGSTAPIRAIQVQGLTKSFGRNRVLRGIDIEISHGESVVIFGPNGAGKTTLLKILATILKPTAGKLIVNGLAFKEKPEEIRRQIGMVSHQTFLYGNLTAYENLEFYCRMYDVPARQERIREVVGMVEMTSRLHDRVGTLSRGMQQRLSIARALLHNPSIMLLDEPETGLDQQSSSIVWELLQQGTEKKRTIILITHSLERGLELCDRVLILAQGQIAYESSKQALDLAGLEQAYKHCTGVGT